MKGNANPINPITATINEEDRVTLLTSTTIHNENDGEMSNQPTLTIEEDNTRIPTTTY